MDDKQTALYSRLRAKLHIDPLRLEEALVEAASILQDAGEASSRATQERDIAKNDLEIARAVASARLRSDTGKDDKKPSEAQISNDVARQKPVQEAMTVLEDAKLDASLWAALVDSINARNKAVEYICRMQLAGFMTPNALHEDRREDMAAARRPVNRRPLT